MLDRRSPPECIRLVGLHFLRTKRKTCQTMCKYYHNPYETVSVFEKPTIVESDLF